MHIKKKPMPSVVFAETDPVPSSIGEVPRRLKEDYQRVLELMVLHMLADCGQDWEWFSRKATFSVRFITTIILGTIK